MLIVPGRFAFKLAYLGGGYHGFNRQPTEATVEGVLLATLASRRYLPPEPRPRVAARTDAGVSARCNVWAVDLEREPILSELNHFLPPGVVAWAVARVDDAFDPRRSALGKTYAYFLDAVEPELDAALLREAATLFEGTRDFSRFHRRDPSRPGAETTRTVDRVEVLPRDGGRVLEVRVRSRAFLWQQVRRMVAAMAAVARGDLPLEVLATWLDPEVPSASNGGRPSPAPARGLVLWDVELSEPDALKFVVDGKAVESIVSFATAAASRARASSAALSAAAKSFKVDWS
ncbi:MAG: tRNA pseudouridine(38-40) synthase TruA [Promethearchaeota archaeon]